MRRKDRDKEDSVQLLVKFTSTVNYIMTRSDN